MSLSNLLKVNSVSYFAPDGQDKSTGALKFVDQELTILGRFGEATTRFDTQEATDQISEASFSTFEALLENGKIVFDEVGYIIVDINVIRNGAGALSHYNYTLKTLDNA
jgi:hypothetical protein